MRAFVLVPLLMLFAGDVALGAPYPTTVSADPQSKHARGAGKFSRYSRRGMPAPHELSNNLPRRVLGKRVSTAVSNTKALSRAPSNTALEPARIPLKKHSTEPARLQLHSKTDPAPKIGKAELRLIGAKIPFDEKADHRHAVLAKMASPYSRGPRITQVQITDPGLRAFLDNRANSKGVGNVETGSREIEEAVTNSAGGSIEKTLEEHIH